MSFYNQYELEVFGFKSIGKNVKLSKLSSIYKPQNISIGDNTRIDDFCLISAQEDVSIGSNVHIGAYSALYGRYGITLQDFVGISVRCTLLSASDDFGGDYLTNPTVPEEYTNLTTGRIIMKKHSILGVNSIVLPAVVFEEGSAVGALSLVKSNLKPWMIYLGSPCRPISERNKGLLKLEEEYKNE